MCPLIPGAGRVDVVLRASNMAVASIETNHRSGSGRQESRLAELVVLIDRIKSFSVRLGKC
jgi:hypothetical protein